ncbi:NB-ARC domain-containing protein [Pseudanabaena yagii]|uniref:Tetratricopeptide repeat protein n=1 Tax=Pseudanabaena yagii GIHE-NHR1 TaxID=2722753 RepID=A0ABX1M1Y9_9CYAN|nr:NB-ARC domain-containing protein [Pseudanabaena yagii]NMF61049.1 tetratricopeptide repeat protein [Pseudanabaena yagii GIHE-NHR1]
MIDPEKLSAIFERIANGEETKGDIEMLRHSLRTGQDRERLQLGKFVINIDRAEGIQIGDRIYQGANAETIRTTLQEVLQEISIPNQQISVNDLGKLSNVLELPPHYLPRTEDIEALKALVLRGTNQKHFTHTNLLSYLAGRLKSNKHKKGVLPTKETVVMTGTSLKVGLQGMGGIGKSVLAAALARDEIVRQAFPDGIIWVTMGQEPALNVRQTQVARAFLRSQPTFEDVQAGRAFLSDLLASKTCLLILDDVWQVDHLAAFNILPAQSRLLITTRNGELARVIGAQSYQLDLLSNEQSLQLLAKSSEQELTTLPEEAKAVVQECGNLPLALSMIGAMARRNPGRWGGLLKRLRQADLDKIRQQFTDYPYPSLLRAIQVSVDDLEPEIQARYLDLAVFPEDVAIPLSVLQTFWSTINLDGLEVEELVESLVNKSLARQDEEGRISLHDLQRSYIGKQILQPVTLHQRLLEAYEARCYGKWATGPNDSYFFEHLAYHLKQAGRERELYQLLTTCPEWMEAKFIACKGDTAYAADLELALANFADPLDMDQVVTVVQLHTSRQIVHERVSRCIDDYLETLVWLDRETEALNHARLRANANSKFESLMKVYRVLQAKNKVTSDVLDEIKVVARAIESDEYRARALSELAVLLSNLGQESQAQATFVESEKTVRAINDDWHRDMTLQYLANAFIQAKRFDDAERIVREIRREEYQAEVMSNLASALARNKDFTEAERKSNKIKESRSRVEALSSLAEALYRDGEERKADTFFSEAEQIGQKIDYSPFQGLAFLALTISLANIGQFEKAEHIARSIKEDSSWRPVALSQLAGILAKAERFDEAERIARGIENQVSDSKAEALTQIAVSLVQSGKFSEAEQIVVTIEADIREQIKSLTQLATALAQVGQIDRARIIFEQAEGLTRIIEPSTKQIQAVRAVSIALYYLKHQAQAYTVLNQAEKLTRSLQPNWKRLEHLIILANILTLLKQEERAKKILVEVEDESRIIDSQSTPSNTLSAAHHWAARKNGWEPLLLQLVEALTLAENFGEAERVARTIEFPLHRAEALATLIEALIKEKCVDKASALILEVEEIAQMIESKWGSSWVRRALANSLTEAGDFDNARQIAEKIIEGQERVNAFCKLAVAFHEAGQEIQSKTIFDETKQMLKYIGRGRDGIEAIEHLAVSLAQSGHFSESEKFARISEGISNGASALNVLVNEMSKSGNLTEAERLIHMIDNPFNKSEALRELSSCQLQAQRFTDALTKFGLRGIDEFIYTIASQDKAFEGIKPGLSIKVLLEVIRIAGWVRSDWEEMDNILKRSLKESNN